MEQSAKWIHFTGIAGVTLGQLAVALSKKGYFVTGSDLNIYEPMKSYLAKTPELIIKEGFNYQNLLKSTYTNNSQDSSVYPDLVIAQGGLSIKNKELLFANKQNIKIENYPQVLARELVVENNSIVVAGSFGKTTTTALLVHIFQALAEPISYMIGGILSHDGSNLELRTVSSKYSIIEGDEYLSSRSDPQSKFFYYKAKYLVLTGYSYDHTDLFLSPEDYFENFKKLAERLPEDGVVFYNVKYPELGKIAQVAKCQRFAYSTSDLPATIESKLLGEYNLENIAAAYRLATYLGLNPEKILAAIATFPGIKRRLEIVLEKEIANQKKLIVIDDFGATPAKAKASVQTVVEKYTLENIVCVYEPNIGNRTEQALSLLIQNFNAIFAGVSKLILPVFDKINQSGILSEQDFYQRIIQANTGIEVKVLTDNSTFGQELQSCYSTDKDNIVLFLSSHSIDNFLVQV